jgi:Ca-activated chloride channel homolog
LGVIASAQATIPPSHSPATPGIQAPEEAPVDTTQPQDDQAGGFVFKKEVEEVVLHAIVVDDQNHLITSLVRDNFQVFEDGRAQELTFFRKEHVPVALGILIDNSGSMLPKRTKVNEAALQLVSASQHEDRVFVVNFGEDAFLDQDYTGDVGKLKAALERVGTQGSTALYDALIASADHLSQGASQQKKVLLVVTDGRDNASQTTFAEVLRKLQSKNGPVVYTIALEQNGRASESDRQSLRTLSEQTGGAAFFPESIDEVQSIARSIAQDIRSQYVIGYRSSNLQTAGTYHAIQVQANSAGARLRVSTRSGYYSGNNGAPQ